MTVDIGNLLDLVDGGVTQSVKSQTLESVIPANLRGADGKWYALSLRDRVLYVEKDLKLESFRYEDLADPKWKGKVCIRSGQHQMCIRDRAGAGAEQEQVLARPEVVDHQRACLLYTSPRRPPRSAPRCVRRS